MASLKVLLVEDDEDDAQLVLRELRRGGFDPTFKRVDTESAMAAALDAEQWDLITCDYSMPRFSALAALDTLQKRGLDIPFIIVSGTIGEDTAVAAMKAGAHDYLMKGQLKRLAAAVERECRDARGRAEERRSDKAAKELANLYRTLVETLPDGVGIVDLNGQFALCNERLTSMHGYAVDELVGKTQMLVFAPEDRARATEAFNRLRAEGGVRNVELTMARKDGTQFPAEFSATTILDDDRKPKVFITVVRDITDRKQLQAHLMLGDRMASMGALAAGVGHEINNPLAYVMANLDFIAADLLSFAEDPAPARLTGLKEAIGDARQGADRIRRIVRDLKIFSRGNDDERGPKDIHQILESSTSMAWNEIRHRARLVKDFGRIPPVDGNEARLGQVFINLLVNAAHAIREGQTESNEIRLVTRLDGENRVVVEVRDTGSGIPPEVLARVFDPFFTTKPVGVGTGLGLSICRTIIAGLGGDISVESVVGKGSTFRVTLQVAHVAAVEPAPVTKPVASGRRGRILIVDDEPMVGAALRRVLSQEHDVDLVTSGREALEQCAKGSDYDVIFSDLMMPEMTGMDLHGELQKVSPEQAARVVFLTGGAFTQRAREFLEQVQNQYIEKPVDAHNLRALVRTRVQ